MCPQSVAGLGFRSAAVVFTSVRIISSPPNSGKFENHLPVRWHSLGRSMSTVYRNQLDSSEIQVDSSQFSSSRGEFVKGGSHQSS